MDIVDRLIDINGGMRALEKFRQNASESFGDTFRTWRYCHDISLRSAAKSLGISASYLSDLERGRRIFNIGKAAKALKVMGKNG